MGKYLLTWLSLVVFADGSHFQGGIITWKHTEINQVKISYRLSFRPSQSSNHFCNLASIENGFLLPGEGSLACTYGCNGIIVPTMSYYCTDFSIDEDWTIGQGVITYTFPITSDNVFIFRYASCCWVTGGRDSWQMHTTAVLTQRKDTGKVNSSPIATMPSIIRLQQGCSYVLVIPTKDDDNDIVKCRWASNFTIDECGSVCVKPPGLTLNEEKCVLEYTATGNIGWYAVALQIEDFVNSSSTVPLSSVPLQFLLNVSSNASSCQTNPVITTNTLTIVNIKINSIFFHKIVADSRSTNISITAINTNSPIGMIRTELNKVSDEGTEWYVNVTWTPIINQTGSHIFCYWARNSYGQSSGYVCQTLNVFDGITCLAQSVVANAAKTQTGDNPNDTITYQCHMQYELTSGDLLRTCQENGTWSGTPPICTIMCLDPGNVLNAEKTQTGDNPNNTITYQCKPQYELTSGDLVRTCQNNGTWSGTAPKCTIMCLDPGIVLNAEKTQTGDNPNNTITYQCKPQYELTSGDLVRTCQNNGTWSGTAPTCIIVCPTPEVVINAVKKQTGDNPGDNVTYTCNTPYTVTSGDLIRICQPNERWSGINPICSR